MQRERDRLVKGESVSETGVTSTCQEEDAMVGKKREAEETA